MKQLWKDCSASQHISTSACLCSQPQSITFPDKKLCFPVYKIVSSVSTDLSPGWVPHITHSQSLAYPLEMDFHWGCACCLETIRVYFTSCSNLISIAMVSWREPWSRSLELNEWMYLSTSEPFKNLPKVLKLSNQTDVKLDEEMSLSISWNRFVLDSTLGICDGCSATSLIRQAIYGFIRPSSWQAMTPQMWKLCDCHYLVISSIGRNKFGRYIFH